LTTEQARVLDEVLGDSGVKTNRYGVRFVRDDAGDRVYILFRPLLPDGVILGHESLWSFG
jgi:hypothetical protein